MAATVHKGNTLGEKHKEYNMVLKEAIANGETIELKDLSFDELDIDNLLKIDIACHNKNVEYVLKVLKCDDMLYVSRVIRKSTWLITENQYENIINPNYLYTKLFPEMTTRARIKLQKNIMHNLIDESRVENFYKNEKCLSTGVKWLLGCSVAFIEENIEKHRVHLNSFLLKRFCEKSVSIFKVLSNFYLNQSLLTSTIFLVYKHIDVYLEVLESVSNYEYPVFNVRATESIMKYSPERIMNNFHIYANSVNMQVFAKYIPKENIKSFLYKQAHEGLNNSRYCFWTFFSSDRILHIIRQLPKDEQFKFVKEVFIDKGHSNGKNKPLPSGSELHKMNELHDIVKLGEHVWYQFATFEVAFEEIKKLILNESIQKNKNAMLLTLLSTTDDNLQNIQRLLNYYKDKHINDNSSSKNKFIGNLMKHTNMNKYDKQTWNILNKIFKTMNVYEESSVDDQNCVIAIILYNVVRAESVPAIIEKKFNFNTLKSYCKSLNNEEKTQVFNYLYKYLITKIDPHVISNESEFKDAVDLIEKYLHLLSDWEKELIDNPLILIKIRKLIEIRQQNSWKIDLSSIYNVKKSWRKHMFNESLALCPSEKVCINALKHDPTLLDRYKNEVKLMRTNDEVSLQRLITKIRIFWSQSLATEWTNEYLEHMNMLGNHKAIIRGLCSLLFQKQLLNIIKIYAPEEERINWTEIDELRHSLQKHIAKNMHSARPQPGADAILLYAKGDYLNYALPSLIAIFYNMSINLSRENITKLLNSRVSLLKHIIRFSFLKLEREDLKTVFSTIWKSSKNATIRCIIFNHTFNLLCNQREDTDIQRYSELLEMFIDNLTSEEDKKLYVIFNEIEKIPLTARANILTKSYKLLQRLVPNNDKNRNYFEQIINTLAISSRDIMDLISSDMATEIVKNYVNQYFFTYGEYNNIHSGRGMVNTISAYFLYAKDIETQTERYETVLRPLIQRCLNLWNEIHEGDYNIKNNLRSLLTTLRLDLKMCTKKINFGVTHNLFSNIQLELKSLTVSENYIMLTTWKLTVALSKLLCKIDIDAEWAETCSKCATEFGKICLEYLKADVKTYFSCIYVLFAKALNEVTEDIFTEHAKLQIFETMLSDKEFTQAYLGVITIFPNYISVELESEANAIMQCLSIHPSVEVKMHYLNRFSKLEGGLNVCME